METEKIRVVVVDDQALFRAGIIGMLSGEADIEVVGEASDGLQALERIDQLAPDIVLMDLRMPEFDGVEATREAFSPVRQARRANDLKIIVLTTFDLDHEAASAIRLGASGYLLKDCTPRMLIDALRTVYQGGAVISPTELLTLTEMIGEVPAAPPQEYQSLTEREREVLQGVSRGLSNAEIAEELFAAETTVKSHVGSILRKLGLRDRVQLAIYSYENHLFGH